MMKRRNKQEAWQDAGTKKFSSSSLRPGKKAFTGPRVIMGYVIFFVFAVLSTLVIHRLLATHQVSQKEDAISHHLHLRSPATKTCVIAVSPWKNFGFVSTLHDTLQESNPHIECFVWFVADKPVSSTPEDDSSMPMEDILKNAASRNFQVVQLDMLQQHVETHQLWEAAFKCEPDDFAEAIKPFAFRFAFEHLKADKTLYFDSNVWIAGSLGRVQEELESHSVVLTPQITEPIGLDGKFPTDYDILQSGVFSHGFLAFRNTPQVSMFLDSWEQNLSKTNCRDLAYDQPYQEFIPSFFQSTDLSILRDEEYNVAYWNLQTKGQRLSLINDIPHIWQYTTSDARRVVFFHFAGISGVSLLDLDEQESAMNQISASQTRFTLFTLPNLRPILKAYQQKLKDHRARFYLDSTPYGFDAFNNGIKISPWMKVFYKELVHDVASTGLPRPVRELYSDLSHQNPFCTSELEDDCGRNEISRVFFVDWILAGPYRASPLVDLEGLRYFSEVEQRIWESHPDLQNDFPDPHGDNYEGFKNWLQNQPVKQGLLDEKLFQRWKETWHSNLLLPFSDLGDPFSVIEGLVWNSRPDLQDAFPDPHGANYNGFKKWFQSGQPLKDGLLDETLFQRWKETSDFQRSKDSPNVMPHAVNFIGWHRGVFGLGKASAMYAHAFGRGGMDVHAIEAFPVEHESTTASSRGIVITRSMSHAVNIMAVNAGFTPVLHEQLPNSVWEEKYNIGVWAWELQVFPPECMIHIRWFDEIWVYSTFIKEAIMNGEGYDGTPVKVLPIPIADSILSAAALPESKEVVPVIDDWSDDTFVFLVIFDFCSTEVRKNPSGAIRAFMAAFPNDDSRRKCRLVVKSLNAFYNDDMTKTFRRLQLLANGDDRIVFITEHLSDLGVEKLVRRANCYVALHRGEGYGINAIEAMSRGVPVIATNFSATTDFFAAVSSQWNICHFPIAYELKPIMTVEPGPYPNGSIWPDPSHDAAVLAMQKVTENDCSTLHEQTEKALWSHFSGTAVAKQAQVYLDENMLAIRKKVDFKRSTSS
jgi:glycosyltransferase involved in cell wall biosynthesis